MELSLILIVVAVIFVTFSAILKRYRRCPSDKVMVIYGKTGKNKSGSISSARCIHGGAAFVWPVFQDYAFLDLKPISIECNLTNALSKQNIRVDVPCRFTVGISTEPDSMTNAAERLLGLSIDNIQNIATDILFGQLRLVIATMDIEEINSDRDNFLVAVSQNVEAELRKIGLKLINVNVTDIRDESGYIEALGKEAAAKAINDAKKSVAEQNRYGEIGKAEADRDKDIRIAETQRDTRIKTAAANALAVQGENTSKIDIANSDAQRREKEAEAARIAVAAEKVQAAKALQEAYQSERDAELARAERERATQQANIVVEPRSTRRSSSSRLRPRPRRSAGWPRERLTRYSQRWTLRPVVPLRSSQSRPTVSTRWSRPLPAILRRLCLCLSRTNCLNSSRLGRGCQGHKDRQGDRMGRQRRRQERQDIDREFHFRSDGLSTSASGFVQYGRNESARIS